MGWVAHVILVSAQVLLVLTLGLLTRAWQEILQNGKTGSIGDAEVTIGETDAENGDETMEEKQVDRFSSDFVLSLIQNNFSRLG